MASFNQVTLLGNLTRDPEVRYLQSGMAVCGFGIAVNEKRKGKEDLVLFIDCTVFDKQAETAAEYLRKGSQVLLNGKLTLDQWEKDGQKHSRHKVTVNGFQMLGSPKGGQHSQAGATEDEYPQAPVKTAGPPAADEIPFAFIGFLLTAALGSGLFT